MKKLSAFQKWYITELVKIEIEEVKKEEEQPRAIFTNGYKISELQNIIEVLKPKGVK